MLKGVAKGSRANSVSDLAVNKSMKSVRSGGNSRCSSVVFPVPRAPKMKKLRDDSMLTSLWNMLQISDVNPELSPAE